MTAYLSAGIDMSHEELAFDSVRKVGPGDHCLEDHLTLDLPRSDEFCHTPYLDLSGGYDLSAPSAYDIAHRKVEELVAQYQLAVPPKIRRAIKAFFKDKYQNRSVADR